jgi:hypothetical protein
VHLSAARSNGKSREVSDVTDDTGLELCHQVTIGNQSGVLGKEMMCLVYVGSRVLAYGLKGDQNGSQGTS